MRVIVLEQGLERDHSEFGMEIWALALRRLRPLAAQRAFDFDVSLVFGFGEQFFDFMEHDLERVTAHLAGFFA